MRRYLASEAAGKPWVPDHRNSVSFGEFLVERRAISRSQLLRGLVDQHIRGGRLGDALVRLGVCKRQVIERMAGAYHRV
jgi:hypothetical protein